MSFRVTSPSFREGGSIPAACTCDGADVPFVLAVSGVPRGTESFAIVMDDPDAPGGRFTHWLACDLPNEGHVLRPDSGRALANDFGRPGYGGPCPPPSHGAHRYQVTVYAVDVAALVLRGHTRAALEGALRGHTLATATLTGRYERRR